MGNESNSIISLDIGIAQSFVDTQSPPSQNAQSKTAKTAVHVHTETPDFCCPCGTFRGWKQIQLGGRKQSRSYSDLRLLGSAHSKGWAWEVENKRPTLEVNEVKEEEEVPKVKGRGRARLEMLPVEILGKKADPSVPCINPPPPRLTEINRYRPDHLEVGS